MKVICPECNMLIPSAQINISAGVAICPNCEELIALSSLAENEDVPSNFDIYDSPAGAWFQEETNGWRIGASTRSYSAFFIVPFMCVWSGGSLGGIYGNQIGNGQFNLFMSLFGIPFILGTFLLGGLAVMTVCGRIDVIVNGTEGRVFTGAGPFGWTRRFDWSAVRQIEEGYPNYDHTGSRGQVISLVGKTRLKFGSGINDARRYYLLQGLRTLLIERNTNQ